MSRPEPAFLTAGSTQTTSLLTSRNLSFPPRFARDSLFPLPSIFFSAHKARIPEEHGMLTTRTHAEENDQ